MARESHRPIRSIMSITTRVKNQHLLWRAAFGPMAENFSNLGSVKTSDLWKQLVNTSKERPFKIEVASNLADGLAKGVGEISRIDESKQDKSLKRKQSREDIKSLNLIWLQEITESKAQLREKMSLFWHGHFACRVINSFFQQELLHNIRDNALGNFGDLLRSVSKSPAMLQFLNNQQNRKQQPNENFAREVMELFTMGRGQYSETDIKEAARAFTGWGFNLQGEFITRPFQHDNGVKTFLGRTGNFNGDDILDILLEQKQTAKYIVSKIYRFFVNEKINESRVNSLSEKFYNSGYEILPMLSDIFSSEWFYYEENLGNHIKSPIELLAGIRRFLPMQLSANHQLLYQKILGQILFFPPNVAGWPGGKNWIDSSSLMFRLQLPMILAGNEMLNISPKDDDDVNMGNRSNGSAGGGIGATAEIDWQLIIQGFEQTEREYLSEKIIETLIQVDNNAVSLVNKFADKSSREQYIKSVVLRVMSMPEYQLC